MDQFVTTNHSREPWNKGKLVGQKTPLKIKDIWAIRVRLQISNRVRDLALCAHAISSNFGYAMCHMGAVCRRERLSCSKRPTDRYNSRSQR
jgi:hypothetical protein